MKRVTKVVMDTDFGTAIPTMVLAYKSLDGNIYLTRNSAVYASHTHKLCKCGGLAPKGWTVCQKCSSKNEFDRYMSLEFKELQFPVCHEDEYFFEEEDIELFLDVHNLEPDSLRLLICEPNQYNPLTTEHWDDILPDDHDFPKELHDKIEEFNKFLLTLPTLSYAPTKFRTKYVRP